MNILFVTAISFLNTPYVWGGNNPLEGLDCSGLVQQILGTVGEDPPGDQTAQGLFDHFSEQGRASWNECRLGSLVFFGKSASKITHVGFCLDAYRMIEAAGGDSRTRTKKDAEKQGAFVRIRLIKSRSDVVAIVRPYYRKIGSI